MGSKPSLPQTAELFRPRLDEQTNMTHPLVRWRVDWLGRDRAHLRGLVQFLTWPATLPLGLVAGLLYLQHTFDAADEAVVNIRMENPYSQFFCGDTYLQTEPPIDPSS